MYCRDWKATHFKRDNSLEALGANSVDRSEIVMMALESLNLNIPLIQTYGPKNIGELSDLLSEKNVMKANSSANDIVVSGLGIMLRKRAI